ncbi:MAG: mechanosensitive ion channel family protein [Chitinispirillia bacterium]|nr:mechanosensitive ion channel family protein [Chitinispirillia bacterium]MCL2267744.1 mechanosensitive ion channel family protein [Chitinispirillia bacterium]
MAGTDTLLTGKDTLLAVADSLAGTDSLTVADSLSGVADTVAAAWTDRVYGSVAGYVHNLDLLSILRMVGMSLAVILILFALSKATRHLFIVIDRRLLDHRGSWFKGIRFRNIDILSSAQLTKAALFVSRVLRYAIYALLLYIALPLIFAIFPATRSLAGTLFSWIVTPVISMLQGFIAYLPKLLRIAIIIVIMRYILKFLKYVAQEIEAGRLVIPKFYPDWAHATYTLLRIFMIAFTIVLIFPLLPESESAVFRGVSVFIGVLFSIGSSSVISNMVAGMVITYMRSFRVGDRIKVGEVYGDVVEKTLFVIRIKTVKREVITVPNSSILSSNIINYSIEAQEKGVILSQDVSVGYDVTWRRAHELLISAALKTEYVLHDPKPFVLTKTLADSAAVHQICVYTNNPEFQARIYSEMNLHILDIFQSEGIEMVVPLYEVLRQDNSKVLPEEYGKK